MINKYLLLIALVLSGLLTACDKKQEPESNPSVDEPSWVKEVIWNEISDNDFTLSQDGQTLLKWHNKNVVNLNMNRNARLKQVKTIGKEPFKGCDKLTAMVMSDAVQTLANESFEGADNLERIYFANVRTIGEEVFKGINKLKELHLPKTLEQLHEEFYLRCDNLQVITIPEDNPKYKVVDNVLFDKEMKTLIAYLPNHQAKSYSIPDGVIRLGQVAFKGNRYLQEIICPPSLVEIRESSFDTIDKEIDLTHYYGIIRLQAKQVVQIASFYSEEIFIQHRIDRRTRIRVPAELVEQYKADKVWGQIADQIESIQ